MSDVFPTPESPIKMTLICMRVSTEDILLIMKYIFWNTQTEMKYQSKNWPYLYYLCCQGAATNSYSLLSIQFTFAWTLSFRLESPYDLKWTIIIKLGHSKFRHLLSTSHFVADYVKHERVHLTYPRSKTANCNSDTWTSDPRLAQRCQQQLFSASSRGFIAGGSGCAYSARAASQAALQLSEFVSALVVVAFHVKKTVQDFGAWLQRS